MPPWLRGSVLLAVTLAAGVAIGVVHERRRVERHAAAGAPDHMLRRLQDELELDSAQARAVEMILARRQGSVDSTWHAIRPHVHAMLDSTLREIAGVLRPDQQAKFRKLVGAMHPTALQEEAPR